MPAAKMNIIIVHPRGVVLASQGWTIIRFTASAGINYFIILKLDSKQIW